MALKRTDVPRRWPFELIGVVVFGLIVWLLFPYISFGSVAVFEGFWTRSAIVLLALLFWMLSVYLRTRKASKANANLESAIVEEASQSSAQEEKLRHNFEEAIEFLRTSGGGRSLYQLPWYVIVGPPGSGKTTALRHSGLNFPLDRKFGKDALRGVGGTRNCDWWFTDEAVLLDTAGRYFSQDSHQASDSSEWQRFLELLAKYRKRQPINGVLVAMSASDLLVMTPSEHDRHVATMRRRIDELQETLRVKVPVYFLVTKCDLVAGFIEFFDEYDHVQRNQVWGMTRPDPSDDKSDVSEWFRTEYDALIERLDEELLERLAYERSTQRRALLFGFPRRMAALREELGNFLQDVFQPHRFDRSILLRGVYFTSGTQEGTPIDRLMESIASAYGVSSELVSDSLDGSQPRSFFLHRALRDVVFSESGLAGVNWRFEVGRAVVQNTAYIGVLTLAGLLIAAWLASYRGNSDYLEQVNTSIATNRPAIDLPTMCGQGPIGVLPRLEALRTIMLDATNAGEEHSVWMGFGLYQGETIGTAARENYLQAVSDLLVPQIVAVIAGQIPTLGNDPTRLFAYLKGYLMLMSPEHRDREGLSEIAQFVLTEQLSGQPEYADRVAVHLDTLLESELDWRSGQIDEAMVQAARSSLAVAGVPTLMLSRMALAYGPQHEHALRLDQEVGLGSSDLMRRKSGRPLSEPIPALYTKAVFEELNKDLGLRLVASFLKDQWVLDSNTNLLGGMDQVRLAADFSSHYESAYADFWDELIGDVEIAPPSGCGEVKRALALLTGPTSPLRGWFQTIQTQTQLQSAPADPTGGAAVLDAGLPKFGDLVEKVGGANASPGGTVTRRFATVHASMTTVDELITAMQGAYMALGDCSRTGIDPERLGQAIGGIDLAAARAPDGVGKAVETLKESLTDIKDGGDRTQVLREIRDRYDNDVAGVCRSLIAGSYPFAGGQTREVAPGDFGRFFAPGSGTIDRYYNEILATRVDASSGRWRWRDGESASGVIPASFLEQFRQARLIRDMFFADGGAKPSLRVDFEVEQLDVGVRTFRLTFGGKALTFRHGAPTPERFDWPGDRGDVEYAFETYSAGNPNGVIRGSWALFRLLDRSHPEPVAGSDRRFRIMLEAGGVKARLIVGFDSALNPIHHRGWRDFRCSSPPAR